MLVEFIRGFLRGLAFLNDEGNRGDCIDILVKYTKNLTPEAAQGQIRGLLGKNGFSDRAALDMEGVKTVLELRSAYGEPKKELTDPMKYIDLSFYEEALASL